MVVVVITVVDVVEDVGVAAEVDVDVIAVDMVAVRSLIPWLSADWHTARLSATLNTAIPWSASLRTYKYLPSGAIATLAG
jgi:hypothetical protein